MSKEKESQQDKSGRHVSINKKAFFDAIANPDKESQALGGCKFKAGDKVFDLRYGAGVVEYLNAVGEPMVGFERKPDLIRYFKNGKQENFERNPILWTLDEARAKGYDVPKEKKKVVASVKVDDMWTGDEGAKCITFIVNEIFWDAVQPTFNEGKTGTLTFEWEE